MITNVFHTSVITFQADEWGEFHKLEPFFKEHGILYRYSCPNTPQQNGTAERKHRHIVDKMRCLLFQAMLTPVFWVEALNYAVHIINKLPSPSLNNNSPHQLLYHKTPIYELLKVFVSKSWELRQLDVKNAFLNGTLTETVYMKQPRGFSHPDFPDYHCLLKKSLYGLKQAPRAWFHKVSSFLLTLGFTKSNADSSLFIFHSNDAMMYLLLYVDDIIITVSSSKLLNRFITILNDEFSLNDLGSLHFFLGIEVSQVNHGLFLSQQKYIKELLKKQGLLNCTPVQTPITPRNSNDDTTSLLSDSHEYWCIVGSL
ncbi:transmembrane signal receptor [Lithospermum erythrorhizon]|uniref:Transmembrane signal receptor n=1 Tax=Lithospermum erythrorhizon TaxID=34254 RepID=A0AAV3Q7Z7_LITER